MLFSAGAVRPCLACLAHTGLTTDGTHQGAGHMTGYFSGGQKLFLFLPVQNGYDLTKALV